MPSTGSSAPQQAELNQRKTMEVESSGYNRLPEAQRAEDKKSLTLDLMQNLRANFLLVKSEEEGLN